MAYTIQAPPAFLEKTLKEGAVKKAAARRSATTYIVDDKDDAFYKSARAYYEKWGYSKIVAVRSLEALLDQLRAGQAVDHVRLVTHGWHESSEQNMELPMFSKKSGRPSAGTGWTGRDELLLGDPGIYVAAALEDIITSFAEHKGGPRLLTHLVGQAGSLERVDTQPAVKPEPDTVESAKSAGLMNNKGAREETQLFEWSTARTLVAASVVLALVDAQRGSSTGDRDAPHLRRLEVLFTDLFTSALARTDPANKTNIETFIEKFKADAAKFAENMPRRDAALRSLSGSFEQPLTAAHHASKGADAEGTFAFKLAEVAQKFSPGAELEIRGCNVGRDQTFMNRLQRLFTTRDGSRAPTISAPTLYQTFTKMAVSSFRPAADGSTGLGVRPRRITTVSSSLLNQDIMVNMSRDSRPLGAVAEDYFRGEAARNPKHAERLRRGMFRSEKIKENNPALDLENTLPTRRFGCANPVTRSGRRSQMARRQRTLTCFWIARKPPTYCDRGRAT